MSAIDETTQLLESLLTDTTSTGPTFFTSESNAAIICGAQTTCSNCLGQSVACFWCRESSRCTHWPTVGECRREYWSSLDGCPSEPDYWHWWDYSTAWTTRWFYVWGICFLFLPLLCIVLRCYKLAHQEQRQSSSNEGGPSNSGRRTIGPRHAGPPPPSPPGRHVLQPVPVYAYHPQQYGGHPLHPAGPPPPHGPHTQLVTQLPPPIATQMNPQGSPTPALAPEQQPSPANLNLNLVVNNGANQNQPNTEDVSPRFAGAERMTPMAKQQPMNPREEADTPSTVTPAPRVVISPRVLDPTLDRLRRDLEEQRAQNELLKDQVNWLNKVVKQ
eukprot:Protomagalhaensia_wolfi_Nauph_80__700@NODE_13_length_5219_cov_204_889189_g10_i0_p2_GENE_NODE_13_length_5219_cov_204_889189_g10_i0NODE_13_length_5219_cov_204_889189_g10_i0_p2_ORF_typecomplete_len330_score31_44SARAF/PF06682_12/0_014WBP1/PF11669_8/1_8e04WBP1/PF11669_8/0_0036WBP1/PF11669_8/1_4e04WBP1/PF11669_8/1_2e04PSI/PF01437_25/0_027Nnf1/PF03980_14/0_78PSI_integrin/PF17205_3/1_5_NODE_13_length_5219_cov_204_889189_g10_i028533842